jgi:hypothetical protein
MDAKQLNAELSSMYTFVESQRTAGREVASLLTKQHQVFLSKVANIRVLTPDDANTLSDAFAHHLWSDEQQSTLMLALTDKLTSASSAHICTTKKNQKCQSIEDFSPNRCGHLSTGIRLPT